MQIGDLFKTIEVKEKSTTCIFCFKKCKNRRGCLISQIVNEVNKEREKPIAWMAINMKLQKIPDTDIAYAISEGKDQCRRFGSFSKAFFGMIKV